VRRAWVAILVIGLRSVGAAIAEDADKRTGERNEKQTEDQSVKQKGNRKEEHQNVHKDRKDYRVPELTEDLKDLKSQRPLGTDRKPHDRVNVSEEKERSSETAEPQLGVPRIPHPVGQRPAPKPCVPDANTKCPKTKNTIHDDPQ
jgi:hypothetical protein